MTVRTISSPSGTPDGRSASAGAVHVPTKPSEMARKSQSKTGPTKKDFWLRVSVDDEGKAWVIGEKTIDYDTDSEFEDDRGFVAWPLDAEDGSHYLAMSIEERAEYRRAR